MEEEHNLESPRVITIENTTEEPIVFQWRLTGNREVVKPEDSIKFTVQTSEELSFFEDQFKELGIEYKEEEPTPPVPPTPPVVLDTKTINITSQTQSISINIEGIIQQLSTLSTEAFWNKLIPSEVCGSYVLFVELGTTGSKQIGFFMNSQDRTYRLGTNVYDDYSVELYEGSIENSTFGDAISRIALLGPNTGVLPVSILGENVTYYTNGVKVNYYNNTDIVEESVLLALPEDYITTNETPSPAFSTKRVNTTNNSITINVSDLVGVLDTLSDTEYWEMDMEELTDGSDIRPCFVLGKTANNEEFGIFNFAETGMKLWVSNNTVLTAPNLYSGSYSAEIGEAIGYMTDASSPFTITTDTLGSYVDYYTNGVLLRYVSDGEVSEVKLDLTMPNDYIV